jgi:hypothetical protein
VPFVILGLIVNAIHQQGVWFYFATTLVQRIIENGRKNIKKRVIERGGEWSGVESECVFMCLGVYVAG